MGLFLALSGVIDAPRADVEHALTDFAKAQSGGFELVQGSTENPTIGVITRNGKNTTVLYPNGFCEWDDASKHLSSSLSKPVFSLHIHDGDLWMFLLFQNGKEISRFNPVPGYWEELSPEDRAKWNGDAKLIASLIPSLSADAISEYFREWDLEQEGESKAYPDDEFPAGDCWQMCDFMKKAGLEYPMGTDGSIRGDTFSLWTKAFRVRDERSVVSPPPPKPWWKIW